MKRKIQWLLLNGGMGFMIYFGFFKGAKWATNIVLFWIWLTLFSSILMCCTEDLKKKAQDRGRAMPKEVSYIYDTIFLLVLVATGWFVTAVAYLIASLCEHFIYDT